MQGFYLITYLRCLVSMQLLSHEDDYLPFVLGTTVRQCAPLAPGYLSVCRAVICSTTYQPQLAASSQLTTPLFSRSLLP